MNKIDQKAIENRLEERGYYRLVERYHNLDDNINLYYKIAFVILSVPIIAYSLYYYPRTFKYLISHPISEILELLHPVVYIYAGVGIIMFIVIGIIQYRVVFKARNIYKQTYKEFGIEEPECEI